MGDRAELETREYADDVYALLLSRPRRRNALDQPLIAAMRSVLEARTARAVVLGSADPRCFSAGVDRTLSDADRAETSKALYGLYETILALDCPVIAAVDGPAVGGGAQLAIACDLRVGSPGARFVFPGVGHGLAVGAWGLPSLVGRGRALDLCLTMRPVAAEEALRIGLLDRVSAAPLELALELATAMARTDRGAAARVKDVVRTHASLELALTQERDGNAASWDGTMAAP
jgi:enoyl-CoA hydratase/carnithine racemase